MMGRFIESEGRWLRALLILATLTVALLFIGLAANVVVYFSDIILILVMAWLFAFVLSPAVTAIKRFLPAAPRSLVVVTVYALLFLALSAIAIVIASQLADSIVSFTEELPTLRERLPEIVGDWQARADALGLQVDLVLVANDALDRVAFRDPVYPPQALRNGTRGWVEVEFTIMPTGSVADIAVIALDGRAGTGKTILAIAAGLEQVVEHARYERLAVYRPLVPVGRADVGFLPGGLDEKLDPWMAAIHDAVVALTDRGSIKDARDMVDELTNRGQLSLESVTFLRGRSLQRQFVVIDEAQNLEPTTLRTILTRVGDGTKVIFTGDTSQIDAPYLGESNNALSVLTSAFAGQRCFGHITLTACERSDVASLAAELL